MATVIEGLPEGPKRWDWRAFLSDALETVHNVLDEVADLSSAASERLLMDYAARQVERVEQEERLELERLADRFEIPDDARDLE